MAANCESDSSKEEDTEGVYLEWLENYGQHKVHLYMGNYSHEQPYDEQFPIRVGFKAPDEEEVVYEVLEDYKDRFHVMKELERFDKSSIWSSEMKDWTNLQQWLEEADYKRPLSKASQHPWQSHGKIRQSLQPQGDLKHVWGSLVHAFKHDFKNGAAKEFICRMCDFLRQKLSDGDFFTVQRPTNSSTTNSKAIIVTSPHDFSMTSVEQSDPLEQSYGSIGSGDTSLSERSSNGMVVPDLVVLHVFKKLFVLNVELRTSTGSMNKAVHQCLKQALSQMHYQDLNFGIVITPLKWCLLVLHKTSGGLNIYQERRSLVHNEYSDERQQSLNVLSFIEGCNWISRIMKYRIGDMKNKGKKRKLSIE